MEFTREPARLTPIGNKHLMATIDHSQFDGFSFTNTAPVIGSTMRPRWHVWSLCILSVVFGDLEAHPDDFKTGGACCALSITDCSYQCYKHVCGPLQALRPPQLLVPLPRVPRPSTVGAVDRKHGTAHSALRTLFKDGRRVYNQLCKFASFNFAKNLYRKIGR